MAESLLSFFSLSEMGNTLIQKKSVLITTHVKPDGDAIGSTIGLATFLRSHGVATYIVLPSPCPDNLRFLDHEKELEVFDIERHQKLLESVDCFVLLDANDPKRTEHIAPYLQNFPRQVFVIDHHLDPKPFASAYLVDTLACSTCHLIADMIESIGYTMSFTTAQALYTGILTDTGNFRFDRTTPAVHRLVARLLECGVQPLDVYQSLFQQETLASMKLMGYALSHLELYHAGRLCIIPIRAQAFEQTQSTELDTEGLSACLLDIKGVALGVLITEIMTPEQTWVKLSFRSRGNISAQALALHFGGGGHFNAAGGRGGNQSFDEVLQRIIELSGEILSVGEGK